MAAARLHSVNLFALPLNKYVGVGMTDTKKTGELTEDFPSYLHFQCYQQYHWRDVSLSLWRLGRRQKERRRNGNNLSAFMSRARFYTVEVTQRCWEHGGSMLQTCLYTCGVCACACVCGCPVRKRGLFAATLIRQEIKHWHRFPM